MNKIIERFLIFVIGVPLVIVITLFLPYQNHLAVNITTIIISAIGALELANLLKIKNNASLHRLEILVLGALIPGIQTLAGFGLPVSIPAAMVAGFSWLLISSIIPSKIPSSLQFEKVAGRIASGSTVMMYPGLLMAWLVKMTSLPHAGLVILVYTLIVISNDSLAWAFGMLFGAKNRGILAVSPSKSVAGFIGGLLASVSVAVLAVYLLPEVFIARHFKPVPAALILGLFSGIAAILGDLGESALKRSANMKDSGTIIPGRGGVLDSIDSLALSAPVYYALYWFLFNQ
ncbi:MAG: phosphatidate cytidylyltransferase [Spirochaetaceae bacterium]|jgi:phosphatidate cytidylyltransferase|nr:phosphatidate cytidylyltransferase [Spirochaetaceae bacterium]